MNGKPVVIDIPKVEDWTITDLRYTCSRNKVKGYTKMTKDELVIEVKRIIENMKTTEGDE